MDDLAQVIEDIAAQLDCPPDNEVILAAITKLQDQEDRLGDFLGMGRIIKDMGRLIKEQTAELERLRLQSALLASTLIANIPQCPCSKSAKLSNA